MEEWRTIAAFPAYQVSSLGRVRRDGRITAQTPTAKGYKRVKLYKDGTYRTRFVHRIVCEAFHGPAPHGHQAAHEDGSKDNNSASNLVWKTCRENHADRVRHGTAKLSHEDVAAIRALPPGPGVNSILAASFGVTPGRIRQLRPSATTQPA